MLIGFKLEVLTVLHELVPFFIDSKGKRTESGDECTINGNAMLVPDRVALGIADAQPATTKQLPLSICVYDEENPPGGENWNNWARQGWPCELGAFRGEGERAYTWFATAHIGRPMFNSIIQMNRLRQINSIHVVMRMNILFPSFHRVEPRYTNEFYLVPKEGKLDFPESARGYVEKITISEDRRVAGELTAEKAIEPTTDDDYNKRLAVIERRLDEFQKSIQQMTVRRRRWWRS